MDSEFERAARGSDVMRQWQLLALASAAYLALGLAAGPRALGGLRPGAALLALAVAAGIVYILIALAMVVIVSRMSGPWGQQLAATLLFTVAFVAGRVAHLSLPGDLCLVLAAIFGGALASRLIRERNILLPVAVVAAVVDTFGVYWGFVAEVAEKAPEVVQQFSAVVPGATVAKMPVPLLSAVGVGDFVFMALFVGAVCRLHMNLRATLWALLGVYLAVPGAFAGVSALTGGAAPILPGLVFLGFAVVAANWRQFSFSRAEKYALGYAALVVAAIILLAWGVKRAVVH